MVNRPGISCEEEARQLKERFEKGMKLKVFSSECKKSNPEFHAIDLHYVDDYGNTIQQMQFGYGPRTIHNKYNQLLHSYGVFESRKACVDAIPFQMSEYEKYTGTPPLAINCYEDSQPQNQKHLLVFDYHRDSVKAILSHLQLYFNGSAYGTEKDAILKRLEERGDKTVYSNSDAILYYDLGPLYVLNERVGDVFESKGDCLNESANHQETLKQIGFQLHFNFCFSAPNDRFTLISFSERIKKAGGYFKETSPKKYDTYSECIADRSSVIEFYQKALYKDAKGGACSLDLATQRYTLLLYGSTSLLGSIGP